MHPRKQRRAEIEVERIALHAQMRGLQAQISALRVKDNELLGEYWKLCPLRGSEQKLLRALRNDPIASSRIDGNPGYRAGLSTVINNGFAVYQKVGAGSRVIITQKGLQQLDLDEEEEKDTSP